MLNVFDTLCTLQFAEYTKNEGEVGLYQRLRKRVCENGKEKRHKCYLGVL